MLDDLLDLAVDLLGEAVTAQWRTGKPAAKGSGKSRTTPANPYLSTDYKPSASKKVSARRSKKGGEDPWDWDEKKPPWEF